MMERRQNDTIHFGASFAVDMHTVLSYALGQCLKYIALSHRTSS